MSKESLPADFFESVPLLKVKKTEGTISASVSDDANMFELCAFLDIFVIDLKKRLHKDFKNIPSDPLDF